MSEPKRLAVMEADEVADLMHEIETSIEDEIGEPSPPIDLCIARLLRIVEDGLDEGAGLDDVLRVEVDRALSLADSYYARWLPSDTPRTQILASVAFLQGVTFAVAAHRIAEARKAS